MLVVMLPVTRILIFRALLHFLDGEKFRSKEEFVERYKNLNTFDEVEVSKFWRTLKKQALEFMDFELVLMLVTSLRRLLYNGLAACKFTYGAPPPSFAKSYQGC